MDIQLTIQGGHDLAGQIYRQLREAILTGRLAAGERLPSTRDLAKQLGVSRKTTLDVFERLGSEGFLLSRPGDGTFIADGLKHLPLQLPPQAAAHATPSPQWNHLPAGLALPRPDARLPFDFMGGVIDKRPFPFGDWRRYINRALRLQAQESGTYRDPAGEPELRLAISRYLGFNRAVTSAWQEIIVTQGAQQALDLIACVVLEPGDVVAVEDPGYPPARICFMAHGGKVVPVPVDEEGIIVEKLPKSARLIYVTPSHQFPLGMPMSLERRIALLEWAQRHGAIIIEDDYDGEYRFEGRPMEPLKSLDRAGLVAYIGTFSKTIFPDLRMGYVVPPATLLAALLKARQIRDWHSCPLTQFALASFMQEGDFAKHLRRMHKHYTERRQALLSHLTGELGQYLDPIVPTAGIHLSARFKQGLQEDRVITAARNLSIGLYGLSAFYTEKPAQQGLLFGYGGIDADSINVSMTRLTALLTALTQE